MINLLVVFKVLEKGVEEKKNNILVGHLPMEVSQTMYYFLGNATGKNERLV